MIFKRFLAVSSTAHAALLFSDLRQTAKYLGCHVAAIRAKTGRNELPYHSTQPISFPLPSLQPIPNIILARQQVLVGRRQMWGQTGMALT
jgi:hypothetical protein